jgi:hypothetical protein
VVGWLGWLVGLVRSVSGGGAGVGEWLVTCCSALKINQPARGPLVCIGIHIHLGVRRGGGVRAKPRTQAPSSNRDHP